MGMWESWLVFRMELPNRGEVLAGGLGVAKNSLVRVGESRNSTGWGEVGRVAGLSQL